MASPTLPLNASLSTAELLDIVADGALAVDAEGIIVAANAAALGMRLGPLESLASAPGSSLASLCRAAFGMATGSLTADRLLGALREGRAEHLVRGEIGDVAAMGRRIELRTAPALGGPPRGGWLLLREVPSIGAADLGAVEREARLRTLLDSVHGVLFEADGALRWTYLSPAWAELTGSAVDATLGGGLLEGVHEDDRPRAEQQLCALARRESAYCHLELRHRTTAGGWRWLELRARAIIDASDHLLGVAGTLVDVTERVVAFEAAFVNEQRYRSITESATDAMITSDPAGRILLWNRAAERMFGWSEAEAIGRPLGLIIPGRHHAAHHAGHARVRAGGEHRLIGRTVEVEALRRDGTEFPIEISLSRFDMDGEPYFTSIIRDISDRRAAERALRESEERLRMGFEAARMASFEVDLRTDAVQLGASAEWLFAVHPREVATLRELRTLVHRDDLPLLDRAMGRAMADVRGGYRAEVRLRTPRGDTRWVECVGVVDRDADAAPTVLRGVLIDVSQRHRLEAELHQAQKMDAIGRLAGSVAHDFNNVLTAMRCATDLLVDDDRLDPDQLEEVTEIQRAVERAQGLTSQLLTFSRKRVAQPEVLDINAVVSGVHAMLKRLVGSDVELITQLAGGVQAVRADRGQLEQVLVNLVVNARDAVERQGRIVVQTELMEIGIGDPRLVEGTVPGTYVQLAVSDTGAGMSPETLARVFEPFFTTKEPGKGTGLGLSTVYAIVRAAGGMVWPYSEPGLGTTFKVLLPAAGTGVDDPSTGTALGATRGSGETVLLVEDDPTVRRLTVSILEKLGYRVLAPWPVQEALRIALGPERNGIDLLVTDVVMPGMSGGDLVSALTLARPQLRVLYVSGYTDDDVVRRGLVERGHAFLQKPFTPATLGAKIREALAG